MQLTHEPIGGVGAALHGKTQHAAKALEVLLGLFMGGMRRKAGVVDLRDLRLLL